ncbi:MAG: glutamate 5-kinase [Clostridiales bacterium]|nr:glutamate 5-kinase [Clostridiales bacterium]MDK2932214.1 glutamate 5-kinase [Clostridiales bacterium]
MDQILKEVQSAERIIVKVGTSTLTYDTGKLNLQRIECLVRVLSDLKNQGKQIVLVTSGAIGVGVGKLGLREKPKSIPGKQAAAAIGQCELMHLYDKLFSEYGHTIAQLLLTKDVVENEHRKNNAINTFNTLLELDVIPIVNENDTIAIEEIEFADNFGDNDTLSAVVSELIGADLLIILSDIDGLYDADPRVNANAKIIHVVTEIDQSIKNLAGGVGSNRGTGGMATKISAAEIACSAGVNMIIANGEDPRILYKVFEGKQVGTLFLKKGQKITRELKHII